MKDRTPSAVIVKLSFPEIEKVTVWRSVAVTVPIAVTPSSTTNVDEDVNTGAVVSLTVTVLDSVPVFPDASVAE